jgi:2-dehydro-3-deoxygalactonokinase
MFLGRIKGKGKPMRSQSISWVVALDGGTTNTRARLLHGGQVVATARRAVGVRDSVLSSTGARPLASAVREAIREVLNSGGGVRPDAIVAAGMLSSEVGLVTVPHVVAPAGLEQLARCVLMRDLPEVSDGPILFVPGIRTPPGDGPDGWAEADVMRGEECETLGVLSLLHSAGPIALLWPGSHTKLVEVDADGRIVRSYTTLAGEITSALARHTLLAASLPDALPENPDLSSLDAGARLVARDGLGRAAFLVRVAALNGAMSPEERAAFWIGAVVADDAEHLARHAILRRPIPLLVGGSRPLRGLYATAISARHSGAVEALSDDEAELASALGALAIARRALGR